MRALRYISIVKPLQIVSFVIETDVPVFIRGVQIVMLRTYLQKRADLDQFQRLRRTSTASHCEYNLY